MQRSIPGSTGSLLMGPIRILGDAVVAPRFLSTAGLGVAGLCLSGSLGLSSPAVNWGQVEDRAEQEFL
jgi:hypothetical protein